MTASYHDAVSTVLLTLLYAPLLIGVIAAVVVTVRDRVRP